MPDQEDETDEEVKDDRQRDPEKPLRRMGERRVRSKLTSMLGITLLKVETEVHDGAIESKDAVKLIKDMADICNKINGSPTVRTQMGVDGDAPQPRERGDSNAQPQFDIEKELAAFRNSSNSPV